MSELALRLIEENKRTRDTFLDLGDCGLKYALPEELLDCIWLKGLNLGDWYYDSKKDDWFDTKNNGDPNEFQGRELSFLKHLNQLEALYLRSTQIKEIQGLASLTNLQSLYLRFNQIQQIQGLDALTNLQSLDFSKNQIQQIQGLASLTNLQSLDLGNNQIQQIQGLEALTNLQSLDLSKNQIQQIQGLDALTNLQSLDLGNNQIQKIQGLDSLSHLHTFYLSNNHVQQIQGLASLTNLQSLYLGANQIQQIQGLDALTNLQILDLSYNEIQQIQGLDALTNLQILDLSYNEIQQIQGLDALTNLQTLYLSSNQIQQIQGLDALTNLQFLNLHNNKIQDISPLLNLIKKGLSVGLSLFEGHIRLYENPIIIPPINIVKQGNEAIIRFFENLLETKYEGKLLIVGEPEAGKTTLRNRLMIPGYVVPNDTKSTVGIQVDKWTPKKPKSRNKIMQVNVWDFGGQDIQYMTHQFFLSSDALYVLLTSARKDLDNLDYWFNIIRLLGKNENNQHSRLLVVANEINMEPVTHFVKEDFKKRYPELDFECFNVNFATSQNKDGRFKTLQFKIEENLAMLPSMSLKQPVKWGIVRAKLAEMTENSISIDRYLQICADAELDKDSAYDLSSYLHTIGEAIHFRNDYKVDDFIILKPKWAVDAVYVILKNNAIKKTGHFRQGQVYDIWKENGYPKEEWSRLLRLMAKDNFEVSYPLAESTTNFIAPQLLSEKQPDYEWDSNDSLKFRYSYAFMPKGIMTRFIVRMHEDIEYPSGEGLVWKNGVVLRDEYTGFMAQVKETKIQEPGLERKVIDIEIMGEKGHRKSLLRKVCKNIEKIHNEIFAGLSFERLVPCNCKDCAGTENPTFYNYSELVELYNEGLDARCRKAKIKEVSITDIFEEIVDIDWKFKYAEKSLEGRAGLIINKPLKLSIFQDPFQATRKDKKIFFSYAWGDDKEKDGSRENIVNELYDSLKSDNYEVVRDKNDLSYKGLISEFMRKIGKGEFVIVAISDKYLKSPYCMFELYEVYRRSMFEKEEFIKKIFPICVENIDFNDKAVMSEYLNHWKNKKDNEEKFLKEFLAIAAHSQFNEYKNINDISARFSELCGILKDMNLKTKELVSKDDFDEIKRAIKAKQGIQ